MDEPRPAVPPAGLLGGRDFGVRLERWLAEARSSEAAAAKARARWLRVQSEESASFAGVLVDLAERRTPVVLHGTAGRRHRGVIAAVGEDFCALHVDTGADAFVAFRGISSVRPGPGAVDARGDRDVRSNLGLCEMLSVLAPERLRVLIVTTLTHEGIAGELRGVGRDVATVRLDGTPRSSAYVPLASIAEVVVV